MKKWLLVPMCLLATFLQADLVPRILIIEAGDVKPLKGSYHFETVPAGTIVKGIRGVDKNNNEYWRFDAFVWGGNLEPTYLMFSQKVTTEIPPDDPPTNGILSSGAFLTYSKFIKCEWTEEGVYQITDTYKPKARAPALFAEGAELTWTFLIFWEEE